MSSRRRDLEAQLKRMFSASEIRRLWGHLPGGDQLQAELPGVHASLNEVAEAAVAVLHKHNMLQSESFWEMLHKERPRWEKEIRALQADAPSMIEASAQNVTASMIPLVLQLSIGKDQVSARMDSEGLQGFHTFDGSSELVSEIMEIDRRVRQNPGDSDGCQRLGRLLSKMIFQGAMQAQLNEALNMARRQDRPLRLDLEFAPTAPWTALSWELIRHPEPPEPLLVASPDIQFVRVLRSPTLARTVPNTDTRPLIMGALPNGMPLIDINGEVASIVRVWEERGVEPEVLLRPTRREFGEAVRNNDWSVLHIATHGRPGEVVLQDQTISGQVLGTIAMGKVHACVLNLCHGAGPERDGTAEHPGSAWRGTAAQLAGAGVRHTIAMGSRLEDRDAGAAVRWHASYAEHRDAVRATTTARDLLAGISSHHAYGFLTHWATGQ